MTSSKLKNRIGFITAAIIVVCGMAQSGEAKPVQVNLFISDEWKETPVENLSKNAVSIEEKGVTRDLIDFKPGRDPYAIALLLDNSSVMFQDYFKISKAAAQLVGLPSMANDKFKVELFNSEPDLSRALTTTRATIMEDLDRFSPGGKSAILASLSKSLDDLEKKAINQPTMIFLLTDGEDSSSETLLPQVLDRLSKSRTVIHVMDFGGRQFGHGICKQIARASGGMYIAVNAREENRYEDAFKSIAAVMEKGSYTATFDSKATGTADRLNVKIANKGRVFNFSKQVSLSDYGNTVVAARGLSVEDTPWVSDYGKIMPSDLQKLINIAEKDPLAREIVHAGERMFNSNSVEEFTKYFHICDSQVVEGGVLGATVPFHSVVTEGFIGLPITDLLGMSHTDATAAINQMMAAHPQFMIDKTIPSPDYVKVLIAEKPEICFSPDMPVREAYGTFIHELTHLTRIKDSFSVDTFLNDYANENAFADTLVSRPGGELDAFTEGFGALARLTGDRQDIPEEAQVAFTPAGQLTSPAELKNYILEGPPHYRNQLIIAYISMLRSNMQLIQSKAQALVQIAMSRNAQYTTQAQVDVANASMQRLKTQVEALQPLEQAYVNRYHELAARYSAKP